MDASLGPSPCITIATAQLVEESLRSGEVCLTIRTTSMSPALQAGDRVLVRKASADELHIGDIVVLKLAGTLVAHRLIAQNLLHGQPRLITKGDNNPQPDSACEPSALVGLVVSVRHGERDVDFQTGRRRSINRALAMLSYRHSRAMSGEPTAIGRVAAKCLRAGVKMLGALFALVLILFSPAGSPGASAAVRVSAFTAKAQGNQIRVTWTTGSEINNVGFNLLRSTSQNGGYSKINATIIPSQCLGCVNGSNYAYLDSPASPGKTYFYRLQSIETTGQTQDFGPVSATIGGATATPMPTATKTAMPTATKTGIPTAIRTAIPTATKTTIPAATKTPTSAPSPVPGVTLPLPMATATWTLASVVATATRAPTQVSESTATATPQTKIAYAVKEPSPRPTAASDTRPSDPPAAEAPIPVTAEDQTDATDEPAEDVPVEQPISPVSGHSPVAALVVYGLVGLLGCGSFVSGLFAIVLFMRASRRY